MPGFIPAIMVLFFAVFAFMIFAMILNTNRVRKQNEKPIKQFKIEGKGYLLFAKQSYNRYYGNQVIYELRDQNNMVIGSFNSLNDVLVMLNIDKFPSEDIFD